MRPSPARLILAAAVPLAVAAAGAVAVLPALAASAGCSVNYSVGSSWLGGFGANVTITNLGDPVSSWRLTWSFGAGQSITQLWNGSYTQTGANVVVSNVSYNGSIPTGGNTSFGFNGSWNGSNPVPSGFALNGVTCNGGVGPSPTTAAPTPSSFPTSPTPTPTGSSGTGSLPSTFRWTSTGVLLAPKTASGHNIVSVKDPSIVRYNNEWLVYATTADTAGGWNLEYTHFSDFNQAQSAPQYYLSDNPNIGNGYRAAPQVFYFAPQNRWYLVYQQGPPAFSTNDDPTKPQNWSRPTNFISTDPPVVQQAGHGWLDFWVICDTTNCYLFGANDAGDIFRAQTTVANFPNGFSNTVVALHADTGTVFEGTAVYKVKNSGTYLMLVEGFDSTGRRIYRSWTSNSLNGSWTPRNTTDTNPFAGSNNVTFPSGQWTRDISHGELIRDGYDQTLTVDPCHLQFLYQGLDPNATGDYSQLPWRLGLLTQTSPC